MYDLPPLMQNTPKVPNLLASTDQWILWRWDERDGKRTKVPCDADGVAADVTDPSSWRSFNAAWGALVRDELAGIGFCFTPGDPFFGIDLDDCLPTISPQAQEILVRFAGTYMEVSPSGTGIKIIGIGKKPEGSRFRTGKVEGFKQLEVYDKERFFTITGRQFGLDHEVADCQDALAWLCNTYLPARQDRTENGTVSAVEGASTLRERSQGFPGTDEDLILYLCDDPKYAALWHGDFSDYGEEGQSEADAALVEKIAWLAGPFPERIARIFEASALCRQKWHDRPDYRDRTIDLALDGKTDFYSGSGVASLPAEDYPQPVDTEESMARRVARRLELEAEADADALSFPIPESGIIRDVVDLVGPLTESPDSTLALGTLVLLSAVAGWSRVSKWGESDEPCILYACICGPSAVGRKTTGMRTVEAIFKAVFDEDELRMESGGHVSGRKLIEIAVGGVDIFYTKEPKVGALEGEEHDQQLADLADWHERKRKKLEEPPAVVLLWDEFAKILSVDGDWQRDTRAELLSMYSGRHRGIKTSGKEGLHVPGGKTQMAFLATMVTEDLRRGLNSSQVTDGLMGRILFSPDGDPKPPLAFPPELDSDYDMRKLNLERKLIAFKERCSTRKSVFVDWTSEAKACRQAWYDERYGRLTGMEALLFGRIQMTSVKIAALLALAEDSDHVERHHVEAAQRMAEVSIQVTMEAAAAGIESQRDRYCDAVHTLLAAGPQPLSKILERGMMGEKEPGERMPERELRKLWLSKDSRLSLEKPEKGGGTRVTRA